MSPEEINVAVALCCGWKWEGGKRNKRLAKQRLLAPDGYAVTMWRDGSFGGFGTIPNYSGSHDAMAEAEKTLTTMAEKFLYLRALTDILMEQTPEPGNPGMAVWITATAPAGARARAFLATKRPRTEP